MQPGRLATVLRVAAILVGFLGAGLGLAGTVGVFPPAGPVHVAGLALLPVALAVWAVAVGVEEGPAERDALLVLGGFGLHVVALLVAVGAAGWWLAGAGNRVAVAAVAWVVAAGGYATLGYLWDRHTDTDVDAVVDTWQE